MLIVYRDVLKTLISLRCIAVVLRYRYLIFTSIDNKRLDEWVTVDRMDFDRVQLPKKEVKVASLRSSRPVSPDIVTCDSGGSNTPPWPTCNLKRHLSGAAATAAVNKKRKLEQAVIAAAAATAAVNNNNSPSTSTVTMTTTSNTNAIMVIIYVLYSGKSKISKGKFQK